MGTLLLRLLVTLVLFVVLVIGVPLTYMLLRGGLSTGRATGLGVVLAPDTLLGLSIALVVSAVLSTLIVRD